MLVSQDAKIFLNNALKPTNLPIELEAEAPLPEVIREMPDQVAGRFVELEPGVTTEIQGAWKRVMIFNTTEVLYTFTFDPQTMRFSARKR